jgi:hypothetical protein
MRPVSAAFSYEAEFNTGTLQFLSTYTRRQSLNHRSGVPVIPGPSSYGRLAIIQPHGRAVTPSRLNTPWLNVPVTGSPVLTW